MSDELIQGRNLIRHGRFPAEWKDAWTPNGVGNARPNTDAVYGAYLMMNALAEVTQVIPLPTFTEAQMEGVILRTRFMYENYNEGPGAGVLFKTSAGVEFSIDLSGKKNPFAEWNEYVWANLPGVTAADTNLEMTLKAPDIGGSGGLRITDVEVDLLLVPLRLETIQLDGRIYEPSV